MEGLARTKRTKKGRRRRWSIWETWHNPPSDPTHLKVVTRQVIGVMECIGTSDPHVLVELLQVPKQKIDCILREIRKSKHPVVKMVLTYGLPLAAAVQLPTEVIIRCRLCGGRLGEVPCIKCSSARISEKLDLREGTGFRDIGVGTSYPPGSIGKVEVMRNRLALGYSAFSEKDVM